MIDQQLRRRLVVGAYENNGCASLLRCVVAVDIEWVFRIRVDLGRIPEPGLLGSGFYDRHFRSFASFPFPQR